MQFSQLAFALSIASYAFGSITLENNNNNDVQVKVDEAPTEASVEHKQVMLGTDGASQGMIGRIPVVDANKVQKLVRRILALREEIATLEAAVPVPDESAKPIPEEKPACEKGDKKCLKKQKKDKTKGERKQKVSKEAKNLTKKKNELLKLETEFESFGKDFETEVAALKVWEQKIVNKKHVKTELKTLLADWQTVWASHPENTGAITEPEFASVIDAVEFKIQKLEYKLVEQKAKLEYLKQQEANKPMGIEAAAAESVLEDGVEAVETIDQAVEEVKTESIS